MEWGAHTLRACDPVAEPTLEQSVPEGLHPVEGTCTGAIHEEPQPIGRANKGERATTGEVHGGLSPMGGTSHWNTGSVRSCPHEKDGAAETHVMN